ncbi:MAG: nicotinate-nucleotide adenylyltransferase [Thermodesulfovibrionales bacterium]
MKIGIFGGTFNPVHFGHLRSAEEAREKLSLDKVLFIPSGNPPLKTEDLAEARHRLRMTQLAVQGNPAFEVLDLECSRPERSYTVDTLISLQQSYAGAELYFMLGIDAFLDIPNWWMPDKLVSLVNFILFSRPGRRFTDLVSSPYLSLDTEALSSLERIGAGPFPARLRTGKEVVMLQVTPLSISSTDIRKRVRSGAGIKYLLPEQVESFIISNSLYTDDKKNN